MPKAATSIALTPADSLRPSRAAQTADVVVFVGGLDNTQEGEELDRVGGSVQLPGQQQALINALAAANPNLVVVLESGGVVALEQSIANIKGLV